MNVKFSKAHLTHPKPKSEDIEKSIGRIKNGKYVFVAEGETFLMMIILVNKINADLLLTKYPILLKSPRKNAQNHGIAKRAGGFLVFGLRTLILEPDEVQSVLSTPPKSFSYMLST